MALKKIWSVLSYRVVIARYCLSLAKKFPIKCLALYRYLSKVRLIFRLHFEGITGWHCLNCSFWIMRSSALTLSSNTSASSKSWAWPALRWKAIGFPSASHKAWILVVNPPLLRPIACLESFFFRTRTVLVSPHYCWINHRILIVWIFTQKFEYLFPNTRLWPPWMPSMDNAKISKTFRKIPPGNSCTVPIQYCF